MGKFNWDDHPVVSPEAVDIEPNKFKWEDHPVVEETSSASKLHSALMGGINQYNAAPVVGASIAHPIEATEAGLNPLLELAHGNRFDPSDTKDFNETRENLLSKFKAAEAANPGYYTGGNLVVGAATSGLLPGAGAAKGAQFVKNSGKIGAAMGGLSGVGNALSEGEDASGVLKSGLYGGVIGGAVGGLAGKVTNMLRPESLESAAATNIVESMMPNKGQANRLLNAPKSEDLVGRDGNIIYKAPEGHNYLEQAGNILKKYFSALESPSEREATRKGLESTAGEAVGEAKEAVQNAGGKFVGAEQLDQYIDSLIKPHLVSPETGEVLTTSQTQVNFLNTLRKDLQKIVGTGGSTDFASADRALDRLADLAYDSAGHLKTGDEAMLASKIRGFLNDTVEKNIADQLPADKIAPYMEAKELYRATQAIKKAAQGASAAEISNRDWGPLGHAKVMMGAHVGGTPGAIAGAALESVIKGGTGNLMASGLQGGAAKMIRIADKAIDKTGEVAQQAQTYIGKALSNMPTESWQSMAQKFATSVNPSIQKLGHIFEQGATRDQIGRNALIFSLMQNSTYRDALTSFTDGTNK